MTVIASRQTGFSVPSNSAPFLRRNPWLMNRMNTIDSFERHSQAVLNGYRDSAEDSGASYRYQANMSARFEAESAAGRPTAQTPETVKHQKEEAERYKARFDADTAMVNRTSPIANADVAVRKAAARYLARLASSGEAATVPTSMPKGDKTEALAKVQGQIADKMKTIKDVKRAPITEEEAVRIAIANLDEKVADAMPRISFDPKRGPELFWNFNALDSGDVVRGAADLEPLVLKLAYPEVVAHIKSRTAQHYAEKVKLSLDPQTKAERLKTISAELLALERIEVELIIALRQSGALIAFRPDTDPRALLGVDGPDRAPFKDANFLQVEDF